MYNKQDIIKILNEFNYFIDEQVLSSFIKNWKIDPMYEDEDGVEFFDNLSIAKIKKGISLKSQGYDNEKIIYYTSKILSEKQEAEVKSEEKVYLQENVPAFSSLNPITPVVGQNGELKNFTVDVTSQTLQMLADALASKITTEIKEQIQNSDFSQMLIQDKSLKEDNENLSKKVEELMDDNKKLAQRVEQLESKKKTFWDWFKM